MSPSAISRLTDGDLLDQLEQAVQRERHATAQLIALLMEVDSRRLHLAKGYASLFTYCTRVLHLSEYATYRRIEAARLARRFPIVLELIESGAITLTALHLLGPSLTSANHQDLLAQAKHRSKHDVEHLVAQLKPREDIPATVAQLANPPSETAPLAPDRYELHCTITGAGYKKLCVLQDLLRHSIPDGDFGPIVERGLTILVDDVFRKRAGAVTHPREGIAVDGSSRYIPASVRRTVWARDGGRCAFVGTDGRCNEGGFLEIHHVVPFALGGRSEVHNLELRCRAHNAFEADARFGTFHAVEDLISVPP